MSASASAPTRPVLCYHGAKWRIAPWVIAHLPQHAAYIEPYGGSAGVLMRKPAARTEVYNDLDGDIVNVFRVLRDREQAAELARQLELTPYAREEFEAAYEIADDPIERARRTIIRAFMGFGFASATRGMTEILSRGRAHRTCRDGFRSRGRAGFCSVANERRMPAREWTSYPAQIPAFVERLAEVEIENRPALDVIRQQDTQDALFYVDPPYPMQARDAGRDYAYEMTDDEHRELAAVLHHVRGMVVLSGYHCELYNELFADWGYIERIALAEGARRRTEVLWFNPAAAARSNGRLEL